MKGLRGLIGAWLVLASSSRARPYLLLTLLVDGAFVFVFLVGLQSFLAEQHGAPASVAGLGLAVYGAAKLAGQPAGGRLIDRLGPRPVILGGLGCIGGGQAALMAASAVLWAVVPGAALYGLGSALLWPAVYALASRTFGAGECARLTATLTLTTGLALAAGIGLGLVLPAQFPYAAAMALAWAAILVSGLVALGLPSADGDRRAAQQYPSRDGHSAAVPLGAVLSDLLHPQRLVLVALILAEHSALGAMVAVFRAYGREVLGVSLRYELAYLLPASIAGAGATVAGGALADRLGRVPLLACGFAAAAPAAWLLGSAGHPQAVVPLSLLAAAGLGLAMPSVAALVMDLSRATGQGTLLAAFMTVEGAGQAIGPAVGAWAVAGWGIGSVLRIAGGLFGLAAAIALLLPAARSAEPAPEPAPVAEEVP